MAVVIHASLNYFKLSIARASNIKNSMSNTTALVKTRRVGGSLVITLPKEVTESKGIEEGEIIEITVKKLHVDGFGALRGFGPFTVEDEMKTND